MAEPLLYDELTPSQRQLLAALSKHPGYEILVMIFHKSCDMINGRLVKLDPMSDHYEKELARLHLQARTVNEFCSAVKKTVEFHTEVERLRRQVSEEEIRAKLQEADNQLRPGNPVPTYPVQSNPKE